jgi:regulator of protease activity HflC (stomatin/prohibitin superfamily)
MGGLEKLVDKIFEFLQLFQFWYVVLASERAVHYRLGHVLQEVGPGPHWKRWFNIDIIHKFSTAEDTIKWMAQALTTKDGQTIALSASITWRVVDVVKFDTAVEDGDSALLDISMPAILEVVREMTWAELVENPAQSITDRLTAAVRARRPGRWGIQVTSVSLAELSKVRGLRLWQS